MWPPLVMDDSGRKDEETRKERREEGQRSDGGAA